MSKATFRKSLGQVAYLGAAVIYTSFLLSVYGEMASQIL